MSGSSCASAIRLARTISNGEGTGTITDNDAPPTVSSVATLTVPEGNTGDTIFASIDLTLSAPSGGEFRDFATVDASATAGSDYEATAGTVELAVGQTMGSVVVPVLGDDASEGDETFDVDLANPVHATLGPIPAWSPSRTTHPIPPGSAVLNVTGATVREGTGGTRTLDLHRHPVRGETTTAVDVTDLTTNGTAILPLRTTQAPPET